MQDFLQIQKKKAFEKSENWMFGILGGENGPSLITYLHPKILRNKLFKNLKKITENKVLLYQ